MPIDAAVVGACTEPVRHAVDARWLMAYAAGLGDLNPRYLDTEANGVIAHPVFPVALEWPVILNSRTLPGYEAMTAAEGARGVHAAHDLHLLRPIRAGDVLETRATVIGLRSIKPGAALTTRLDTVDAKTGALVAQTFQLGISRGVAVTGVEHSSVAAPPWPVVAPPAGQQPAAPQHWRLSVAAGTAHRYTECARIWNPIHTDRAVALRAGLPDIILHGTATLALAISRLVNDLLAGDATRVRRLGGRFRAMVLMPSELQLRVLAHNPNTLFFEVYNPYGSSAFSDGFLVFAD